MWLILHTTEATLTHESGNEFQHILDEPVPSADL